MNASAQHKVTGVTKVTCDKDRGQGRSHKFFDHFLIAKCQLVADETISHTSA